MAGRNIKQIAATAGIYSKPRHKIVKFIVLVNVDLNNGQIRYQFNNLGFSRQTHSIV